MRDIRACRAHDILARAFWRHRGGGLEFGGAGAIFDARVLRVMLAAEARGGLHSLCQPTAVNLYSGRLRIGTRRTQAAKIFLEE